MNLKPQLVIFDMDGLLLDTERLYFSIYDKILNANGINFSIELYSSLVGINHLKSNQIYRELYGAQVDLEPLLIAIRKDINEAKLNTPLPLKPGTRELLDQLRQAGIQMAVSSSTFITEVHQMLGNAGIADYFDVLVGGDMIKVGKPDPDAFLLPCQLSGTEPAAALVLEDSQAGIESASSAGIPVICVPDMQLPDQEHRDMAFAVVDSLYDVMGMIGR